MTPIYAQLLVQCQHGIRRDRDRYDLGLQIRISIVIESRISLAKRIV